MAALAHATAAVSTLDALAACAAAASTITQRLAWVASTLDCVEVCMDWRPWFVLALSLWQWRRTDGVLVGHVGVKAERGGPRWDVASARDAAMLPCTSIVTVCGSSLAPNVVDAAAFVRDCSSALVTLVPEALRAGDVDEQLFARLTALWRKFHTKYGV